MPQATRVQLFDMLTTSYLPELGQCLGWYHLISNREHLLNVVMLLSDDLLVARFHRLKAYERLEYAALRAAFVNILPHHHSAYSAMEVRKPQAFPNLLPKSTAPLTTFRLNN